MGWRIVTRNDVNEAGNSPAHRFVQTVAVPALLIILVILPGCSLSTSSSEIVSSPFTSSSESLSSTSGDRAQDYQADVRDYTEAYARSSSDITGFRNGLGSIAQKHGITNWEADQNTYSGIGAGLAKAQATQMQVEVYKANLAPADPVKAAAIQAGYEQVKR